MWLSRRFCTGSTRYRVYQSKFCYQRSASLDLTRHLNTLINIDIYGVNRNVQKGFLYHAASVKSGGVNTFNSIDRTVHSHKRRSMASCFTDHALRINEDSMLPIIRRFLTTLSGDGRVPWEGEMSQWSTYLVFDVMGRLSFGKDFGMLSGPENRPVAKLIESNTHITLMVSCFANTSHASLLSPF